MAIPKPSRQNLINQMRGMLKNDQPSPNDAQVLEILDKYRVEKYLK